MNNEFLSRLLKEFRYLNKVPKFQLERAISPLLGIFIKEIINIKYKTSVSVVFPEFPLKGVNNQSTNIDWLLIDRKNKHLYFIELKTDILSFDEEQYTIYKNVRAKIKVPDNAKFLLNDLKNKISPNSNRKEKYVGTLTKLHNYKINLSLYKHLTIIYLAPRFPDFFQIAPTDRTLPFDELPPVIKTKHLIEYQQLIRFLKSLAKTNNEKK